MKPSKHPGLVRILLLAAALNAGDRCPAATLPSVPRFAPHEISFTATGTYANPYVELTADATLTEPDGRTKLEPHDELVTSTAPRTADRATRIADRGTRGELGDRHVILTQAPATTYWCLAEPGKVYVAYLRGTTQPVAVNVGQGGPWKASRFDPRTGQSENITVTAAGDRVNLTAPDEQDWLWVVRSDAARASAGAGKMPTTKASNEIRPKRREIAAPWQPPTLKLAGEIVLNAAGPSPLEEDRKVLGGTFAPEGWRPADKLDRLVLTLKEGFDWDQSGALELDMTNLDFDAQVDGGFVGPVYQAVRVYR